MLEKILENVINEMTPYLSSEQLEHLGNVLYLNFHGKEIQEEKTELMDTGVDPYFTRHQVKVTLVYLYGVDVLQYIHIISIWSYGSVVTFL